MNIRTLSPVIAAAWLVTSLSVSAQSSPPSVTDVEPTVPGTCQDMMDKARPAVDQMSDQDRMKAEKETESAQTDMDASKWKACKAHMQKVLDIPNSESSN